LVNSAGQLTWCLIAQNLSTEGSGGGGIAVEGYASFQIRACTIAGNVAGSGAGVQVSRGATVAFERCILWGNCGGSHLAVGVDAESYVSLRNCAVERTQVGGTGRVDYRGEILEEDPRFCHPGGCSPAEAGDYRLRDDSPYRYPRSWGSEGEGCTDSLYANREHGVDTDAHPALARSWSVGASLGRPIELATPPARVVETASRR
jgi:hypothetical protein